MSGNDIADDGNSDDGPIKVNVLLHVIDGVIDGTFIFQMKLDSTVKDFRLFAAGNCRIPAEQQILIYKGRIMTDDRTLESYGIEEGDVSVDMVRFRDAAIVNAHAMQHKELVERLDESSFENLAQMSHESLSIMHMDISRMRTTCDRNLSVLRGKIQMRNPDLLHQIDQYIPSACVQTYQIPQFTPATLANPNQIRHYPRPPITWQNSQDVHHFPQPQTAQYTPQIMHHPGPQITQQNSQGVRQLPPPQTAQSLLEERVINLERGQTSGSGAAHNDEGTSSEVTFEELGFTEYS